MIFCWYTWRVFVGTLGGVSLVHLAVFCWYGWRSFVGTVGGVLELKTEEITFFNFKS